MDRHILITQTNYIRAVHPNNSFSKIRFTTQDDQPIDEIKSDQISEDELDVVVELMDSAYESGLEIGRKAND